MSYAEKIIAYVERNFPLIEEEQRFIAGEYRWQGKYKHGKPAKRGAFIFYVDKLFVALRDTEEVPKETGADYAFLVNLTDMKASDIDVGKLIEIKNPIPPIDKRSVTIAMVSTITRNYVEQRLLRVMKKQRDDLHSWKGVFHSSKSYVEGDVVAYNHGIWIAKSGTGVPDTSDGWESLERITTKRTNPQ